MTGARAFVSGMGIITPLGGDVPETLAAIRKNRCAIRPLSLSFTGKSNPLPVGEILDLHEEPAIPRTHQLARRAADQAMAGVADPLDAVVLGITTGGMLTTETLLKNNEHQPERFHHHGPGSVTEDIAARYACKGPIITVATACSSGAVAIKLALELIRTGRYRRVLAGGADALCRLTYYGFHALQIIAPDRAAPLDRDRSGMTIGEGAAMLLLTADDLDRASATIRGAGLSCDAFHPTAPDPNGKGALSAMRRAIQDAGIHPSDIDYLNLHGTGTVDNDRAEAAAVNALFSGSMPPLSSVKGGTGHCLAAAGAIEAVVSVIGISNQIAPATTGCRYPDPLLKLDPIRTPRQAIIKNVLSNSFGFGGNNASVVIGGPDKTNHAAPPGTPLASMEIMGSACVTGAGDTLATLEQFSLKNPCKGVRPNRALGKNLSAKEIRRMKRFPIMALSLATAAYDDAETNQSPFSVFLGTGWGALSETHSFLTRLFETHEQYASPTDFVGSVHNAAAGLIAMKFKAIGPNITTTGGDYSFEQALMSAALLSGDHDQITILAGADEYHNPFSLLFDPSMRMGGEASDGGGAFLLKRRFDHRPCLKIRLLFYQNARANPGMMAAMINMLGGSQWISDRYATLFAGIPQACRTRGEIQLREFIARTRFSGPIIDYRKLLGEYPTASAVAAVLASRFIQKGALPEKFYADDGVSLKKKGVLLMGWGDFVTAIEIMPE